MDFGSLKPLVASLLLPPLSLLLLALLGLLLAARKRRGGLLLAASAIVLLAVLSCQGTAVWLAHKLLPQFSPLTPASLATRPVQAIVILGGGVLPEAPEYGVAQPGARTAARLRYGAWLARQSGLPVAFTGGLGWGSTPQQAPEGEVAARVALEDYGLTLRWVESQSRDTAENARMLVPLLQKDQVSTVALVTDAWHMPRAVLAFERAGLTVVPAPTGFVTAERNGLMQWVPSASALVATQQVLREWLALIAGRLISR